MKCESVIQNSKFLWSGNYLADFANSTLRWTKAANVLGSS